MTNLRSAWIYNFLRVKPDHCYLCDDKVKLIETTFSSSFSLVFYQRISIFSKHPRTKNFFFLLLNVTTQKKGVKFRKRIKQKLRDRKGQATESKKRRTEKSYRKKSKLEHILKFNFISTHGGWTESEWSSFQSRRRLTPELISERFFSHPNQLENGNY